MDGLFTMISYSKNITLTYHAISMSSARNIKLNDIDLCLRFGEKIHKTKIQFYFMSKKALKNNNIDFCIEGLCVLVSNDNTVITVYKNKDAISDIKKLSKRSLKH